MNDHSIRVRPATDADRSAWDAFVASRPEGDPLQTWGWGEANRGVGEQPHRLLVERPGESIRGVAQLLVRSAGFGRTVAYSPHGPLWQREGADADEVLEDLLGGMATSARELRAIVVKVDPRATPDQPAGTLADRLGRSGIRRARHDLQAPTTRILEITGSGEEADLMEAWDKDARNLVRRSRREGVTTEVVFGPNSEEGERFSEMLEDTAKRGRFRARDQLFLEALIAEWQDGVLLTLARWQDRDIAGMLVPIVGDRAFYLYGASVREPDLKHTHGAYAAMAATLTALSERAVRTFDLWGVAERDDPTAEHAWEGFSAFKRQFGGTPLRHPGTFDRVIDPLWYRIRDVRERVREVVPTR